MVDMLSSNVPALRFAHLAQELLTQLPYCRQPQYVGVPLWRGAVQERQGLQQQERE